MRDDRCTTESYPVVRALHPPDRQVLGCRPSTIGTQGGPGRRLQLIGEAGFRSPTLAADTDANLVLARWK